MSNNKTVFPNMVLTVWDVEIPLNSTYNECSNSPKVYFFTVPSGLSIHFCFQAAMGSKVSGPSYGGLGKKSFCYQYISFQKALRIKHLYKICNITISK